MTQEEKARAYDEALKRAKAAIDIAADKDLVKGVATTIFPELAESEDERIRKDILFFLNEQRNAGGLNRPDWIAWLEKQKEQKPISFNEPYTPDDYEVIMEGNATSIRRKQQKPVEWSEEDEKNLELVIDCIYEYYPEPVKKYKLKDWLKSLRPSWKPSEELMGCLERVMAFKHPEPEDIKGCEELLEQLKKLM